MAYPADGAQVSSGSARSIRSGEPGQHAVIASRQQSASKSLEDVKNVEPVYAAIGGRIRFAREKTGMTQYELADAIGVSRPSIQMMERGAQRIHVHIIFSIAKTLDVDPVRLLFDRRDILF